MTRSTNRYRSQNGEKVMERTNVASERVPESRLGQLVTPGLFLLLLMMSTRSGLAQEVVPKTFSSAAEASHALFLAVRNEDEQSVGAILGAGKEITSSNDEVEDNLEHERFAQKYQEMHRLVQEPDGNTVLYVGAENWPFPIPLVLKNGRWYFDSDAGTQEMLFRTVGENETTAIEVCRAFAAAKSHQPKATGEDQINQYAQSLISAGLKDATETPSTPSKNPSSAFHGYYFRIGTEQTVDGASPSNTYGFASKKNAQVVLVAVPAEYRGSGVMTFIVTRDGAVYQKDLGTRTTMLEPAAFKEQITKSGWKAVK